MFKAIIFDFFDVIRTDPYQAWLKQHGYKREGKFLEASQRQDRGEIGVDEFLETLSQLTGQSPKEIFDEMEADAKVDYDVVALVDRLHKSYRTALLSNAPSSFLRGLLRDHDLEKHFDEIVISSEVGLIKPSAEVFQHLLSKLNVRPEEAVFIDDAGGNVEAARRLGIKSILYTDVASLIAELKTLHIESH